jgi:hypothetical protein
MIVQKRAALWREWRLVILRVTCHAREEIFGPAMPPVAPTYPGARICGAPPQYSLLISNCQSDGSCTGGT